MWSRREIKALVKRTLSGERRESGCSSTSSPTSELSAELSVAALARCPVHDAAGGRGAGAGADSPHFGWAEPAPLPELPLVVAPLHRLALHVNALLQSHNGSLPLASVPRCFESEIGPLDVSEERGVPLEHLISCVKGVGIVSVAGHKRLQWAGKNELAQDYGPCRSLPPF